MEDEASDISLNDIRESLLKHIEKCKIKSKFHNKNGTRSMHLENILTLSGVTLNATLALLMVILSTNDETDDKTVAIVSACFSFSSIILEKIRQNYNFALLSYSHNSIADEFMDLRYQGFSLLSIENYDPKDYRVFIAKYLSICARGHIQSIGECKSC